MKVIIVISYRKHGMALVQCYLVLANNKCCLIYTPFNSAPSINFGRPIGETTSLPSNAIKHLSSLITTNQDACRLYKYLNVVHSSHKHCDVTWYKAMTPKLLLKYFKTINPRSHAPWSKIIMPKKQETCTSCECDS